MAIITFLPAGKLIQVKPGTTLLSASRKARIPIRTRCGGKAACLMCKVIVEDQSGLAPMNQKERLKLGGLASQGYRLACQCQAMQNVEVRIPEDPLKTAIRLQLEKQRRDELF